MSVRDVIQAAAGAAGTTTDKTYIEDVFSTYLYTGNGSTQTINNGIDLAGKGGLVWCKWRGAASHLLFDTSRGALNRLNSNTTNAQLSFANTLTSFNSNGFSLGSDASVNAIDPTGLVSWTFRKAPKFFDVVTYTGNGVNQRQIPHSLGIQPGMIIVKRTDTTGGWKVRHATAGNVLALNTSGAEGSANAGGYPYIGTSTYFMVGNYVGTPTDIADVNASGGAYVAYLFAHDTTADGLIQCGSFTTDGSGNASVNLGWEPQYLIFKAVSGTSPNQNWWTVDNMRGWTVDQSSAFLLPNLSNAEFSGDYGIELTNTGFKTTTTDIVPATTTHIYMAIRRGPMRTPTDGTKVFKPFTWTGNNSSQTYDNGFPVDAVFHRFRTGTTDGTWLYDRLRGKSPRLVTSSTAAENNAAFLDFDKQNSLGINGNVSGYNASGETYIHHNFRRAPGFFDVVCYTGTGVARTVNHNLGVAPELVVIKKRSATSYGWYVGALPIGFTKSMYLNLTGAAVVDNSAFNSTTPTSTVFTVRTNSDANQNGATFVAYLFASCPGVSKVGSYTGNGTSQTINCGFTNGARFVLIKRTDSTGDWYIWDTARGIVAGTDPHLSLNTTAAEVTTDNTIDPDSTGFIVNQVTATNVNVSAATYIYLAIA